MIFRRQVLFISAFILLFGAAEERTFAEGDAKRGEYLVKVANCIGCHTEEHEGADPYAGGRSLKTPFGTFFGPNITQDLNTGIGRWTEVDFVRAMRFGIRPDGATYFPAFPYPSYTKISAIDMSDMWAYLRTLKPAVRSNRTHELGFFFRWRFLVRVWKWLFFTPGSFIDDPGRSPVVNRGAYLVQAVCHCGECHTPRNALGAPKSGRYMAGGKNPEGKKVPNLTPTGLNKWSDQELRDYLTTGIMPDGDVVNKTMGEVIQNSLGQLTGDDLTAVTDYLRSLTPVQDEPG